MINCVIVQTLNVLCISYKCFQLLGISGYTIIGGIAQQMRFAKTFFLVLKIRVLNVIAT